MSELTKILHATAQGDSSAARKLLPLVYDELRQLAARKMTQESSTQTLQPTALVHEAWLRLGGDEQPTWENRTHFFCAAAEAMRRILIDRARSKQARRHGGGQERLDIDEVEIAAPVGNEEETLAVNEALDQLAAVHPEKAELVKLRYFAGLSFEEVAEVLGMSLTTAEREWAYARGWLHRKIVAGR